MKNRSRTDIISDILDAANGGASKTRIMYAAFLSYSQLKGYLSTLVQNGLLEYVDCEHEYRTTEKGIIFVRATRTMNEITGFITS